MTFWSPKFPKCSNIQQFLSKTFINIPWIPYLNLIKPNKTYESPLPIPYLEEYHPPAIWLLSRLLPAGTDLESFMGLGSSPPKASIRKLPPIGWSPWSPQTSPVQTRSKKPLETSGARMSYEQLGKSWDHNGMSWDLEFNFRWMQHLSI